MQPIYTDQQSHGAALSKAANACLLPRTSDALDALFGARDLDPSFRTFVTDTVMPAAHELGQAWVDDTMSFGEVTVGLARLQTAVQKFPGERGNDTPWPAKQRSVFLAALADTQHTLGAVVAARAFADAGWNVVQLAKPDLGEAAISYLRTNVVELVALAVGTTDHVEEARMAVERIRSVAPKAEIYLAGPAVANAPELFADMGADRVGDDPFDVAA